VTSKTAQRRLRVTVKLPEPLIERARNAVSATENLTFAALVEHCLTALLECFHLCADIGRDLAGFDARLRHRVFHGFGRLITQFHAFLLDLGAGLFPRLRRQ